MESVDMSSSKKSMIDLLCFGVPDTLLNSSERDVLLLFIEKYAISDSVANFTLLLN